MQLSQQPWPQEQAESDAAAAVQVPRRAACGTVCLRGLLQDDDRVVIRDDSQQAAVTVPRVPRDRALDSLLKYHAAAALGLGSQPLPGGLRANHYYRHRAMYEIVEPINK